MFDIHKIYTNGVHVSCMTKITFMYYVLPLHTGKLLNK